MKPKNKQLFLAAIPIVAFTILGFWRGWDIVQNYLPLLALCWLLFQFGKANAGRTLTIFSATIVVLLAIAIVAGGKIAIWCIVGIGLFTSIGWPNIFSLALDRMGVLKSQVSSLLVMAVLGGAILPPIQGRIADLIGGAPAGRRRTGLAGRPVGTSNRIYCSADCLRLRGILRLGRPSNRTQPFARCGLKS